MASSSSSTSETFISTKQASRDETWPTIAPTASPSTIIKQQHLNSNSTAKPRPFDFVLSHVNNSANFKDRCVIATKLVGDVLVAVTVTAMAAPFLAVIDKALVERTTAAASSATTTTNRITVWTSMYHSSVSILQHPKKFFRSPTFLWMWGTYAATYTAANTLRTLLEIEKTPVLANKTIAPAIPNNTNSSSISDTAFRDYMNNRTNSYSNYFLSAGTTLLIGTSIVNSTASVLKDRAYAQLYGAAKTTTTDTSSTSIRKLTVPKITYGLWLLRDLTVIGAAFVLPNHVAQFWIEKQNNGNNAKIDSYYPRFSDATIIRLSQIGTPVMAQVFAGPLHFIGYDCYNYHNAQASLHNNIAGPFPRDRSMAQLSVTSSEFWLERMHNLRSSIGQVIIARMMRIIPGYGIAGICNNELLVQWKNAVVQPMIDSDKLWYRNDKCDTGVNAAVWNQHNQQRC